MKNTDSIDDKVFGDEKFIHDLKIKHNLIEQNYSNQKSAYSFNKNNENNLYLSITKFNEETKKEETKLYVIDTTKIGFDEKDYNIIKMNNNYKRSA